ncbi:MAG: LCP family protein [Anaerolineaceae bacterium]|nr:LCP family protein [Anaerolineaceae bacterium]
MTQVYYQPQSKRKLDKTSFIILIVCVVLGIGAAFLAYKITLDIVKSWEITNDLPGAPVGNTLAGANAAGENSDAATGIFSEGLDLGVPEASIEPWDGAKRINVLFMGLDYRDWEAGEIPRTDTMILLTLDPVNMTAGMLSIPRDMWVNIPGYDHAKINTGYYLGEIYKLPGGGPQLAMDTVEEFLGVPIDYYAQIDFMTFVDFIDMLGGLDIHIREEISVGILGEKDKDVMIYEGVQNLSGLEILGYARSRYTSGGDFDRAKRQQYVIMTMREQFLTFNMLPLLVSKAPELYAEFSSGIKTNLSVDQIIRLANLALQIPEENIHQAVISPDVVYNSKSPDGLDILIPIPDEIRPIRDSIFTSKSLLSPINADKSISDLVAEEGASIVIHNGTGEPGIATRTSDFLKQNGINVIEENVADQVYNSTTILLYNTTPYSLGYIADLMNVSTDSIYIRYTPDTYADMLVIIGNDWVNNNPMP